jgi:hypothetical protein
MKNRIFKIITLLLVLIVGNYLLYVHKGSTGNVDFFYGFVMGA